MKILKVVAGNPAFLKFKKINLPLGKVVKSNAVGENTMLKKIDSKKVIGVLALMGYAASNSMAAGVSYFTIPADFTDNVIATLVVAATAVLSCIAAYYGWGMLKRMFSTR